MLAHDKRALDDWVIPQFAATGDPDAWKATLRRMFPDNFTGRDKVAEKPGTTKKPPTAKTPKVQRESKVSLFGPRASDLIARFGTRKALVRHLQEGHKLLDELAEFPFPPPGKPSPELRARIGELEKENPLLFDYCSLHPAILHAWGCRAPVEFQMVRAAIAVQRHGPAALKDYPDPSGDGPFEYRKRRAASSWRRS